MDELKKYIAFRYCNWLDYARQMAKENHFTGMEDDLLHDVLIDVLNKNQEKIKGMFERKTTMLVNGEPTTELDKFILRMLKVNAFSPVAPFRKNTLGHKVLKITDKTHVETATLVELNGTDCIDEVYNEEQFTKLDRMHRANLARLKRNGFNRVAAETYILHFIQSKPAPELTETQREILAGLQKFLTNTQKTITDDKD